MPISETGPWFKVAVGSSHVCAIKDSDKSLWCWGFNDSGQVGDGTTTDQSVPVKIGSDSWDDVSTGLRNSCGIKADGSAWCWGSDISEALGDGPGSTNSSVPVEVSDADQWSSISTSRFYHSCGVKADGSAWCWGAGGFGQLGTGTTPTSESIPVKVTAP